MQQKKLNFFKIQSPVQAINIIEDDDVPVGVDEYDANVLAWQYLIDTGIVWQLQGWYGRCAKGLIQEGICKPKKTIGATTESTQKGIVYKTKVKKTI